MHASTAPDRGDAPRRPPPYVQLGVVVLLDRDGVISEQNAFVNEPDDLTLIPGAVDTIGWLNRAGWPAAEIILQHHERLDGSGYPGGIPGDAMLRKARILAVADVVEAMGSYRPYRPSLGIEAGLQELEEGRGVRYDAEVVDVCLRPFREEAFSFEQALDDDLPKLTA